MRSAILCSFPSLILLLQAHPILPLKQPTIPPAHRPTVCVLGLLGQPGEFTVSNSSCWEFMETAPGDEAELMGVGGCDGGCWEPPIPLGIVGPPSGPSLWGFGVTERSSPDAVESRIGCNVRNRILVTSGCSLQRWNVMLKYELSYYTKIKGE